MIFSASKNMYQQVLLGNKTLTSRVKLPAHIAMNRTEAIVPGRAKAAWWMGVTHDQPRIFTNSRLFSTTVDHYLWDVEGMPIDMFTKAERMREARRLGLVQAKIVTRYWWQNHLQDMTQKEAVMEGVGSVAEYAVLWNAINTAKAWRWEANPLVWRVRIERTSEVAEAVQRIGVAAIREAA